MRAVLLPVPAMRAHASRRVLAGQRRSLRTELTGRLLDAHPDIRKAVALLGGRIIREAVPVPRSLNLTYAEDGTALFALFGLRGREIELWVGEQPNEISYVATDADGNVVEGSIDTIEYERAFSWLRGDTDVV